MLDLAEQNLGGVFNATGPAVPLGQLLATAQRVAGSEVTARAIARLGSGVIDVSNVHGVNGHAVDWAELAAAISTVFPQRTIVGYERGADLDAALAGGFEPVGELRVWAR